MQTEEQKRRRRNRILKVLAALMGVFLLIGCCVGGLTFLGSGPTITPTPIAADVATIMPTSVPTSTSMPTPRPTWTPWSTSTSQPTMASSNGRIAAQVIKVVDGDTIKVEIEGAIYTVRYIGIDTPETVHPSKPVERMGPEASEANRRLVEGQTVYLEKDISETDRYGRLLLYVFLADGTFVNAELVRLGYAQASTYPPDVRYQDLFLEMQQEAREAKRGLWGPTPTPQILPTATSVPPTVPPIVQPTQPPSPTAAPTVVPSQLTPGPNWWMCPDSTEGAIYVGSVQSSPLKFHKINCRWAAKISAANRICFASRQAALDLGYRPCKVCNP